MAINYSTNPYSGGAVVFDQRPFMAFYERQMARQQAKQDALENYFKDLNKNITSTGMRSQDVPALLKQQQQWQQFYQQNKDAILNPKIDGGQAYSQYLSGYQGQLATINGSKQKLKTTEEIGKATLNPQMAYIKDDPYFMEQMKRHDLPIDDPNHQEVNLTTLITPPKPIDTKEWESYSKYLTGGLTHDKIPGQTENLPGFKTRTPIYAQYSPDNLKVIGQHAMNAYDTDRRWRLEGDKYFKELQSNPEEYEKANTIYKQLYGNDIDDPKEAWAAKGIMDNNMKATEYKEGENEVAKMAAQEEKEKRMLTLHQMNAKELIDYKKHVDPNDTEMNNTWVQNFMNKSIEDARANPKNRRTIYDLPNSPSTVHASEINPTPILMNAFTIGTGKKARRPDRLYVTDDNKIVPIYYQYDNNGVKKDAKGNKMLDNDYSRPLSIEDGWLALGYKGQTKKELGKTMSNIKNTPPAKTTPAAPAKIEDLRKKYNY